MKKRIARKIDKTSNIIEGSPTKGLFINFLVKDITLKDAIGDLVDNAIDAARKNARNQKALSGFIIRITLSKTHFEISDNCGGLEVEIARESAFCFGKPKEYKPGKHTIGQFGIGMKRAFFKIGNYIDVDSIALRSIFKMHIDVPVWREKQEWDFEFETKDETKNTPLNKTKTTIRISELNQEAEEKFDDNLFLLDLQNEIALEHLFAINSGLKIIINGVQLRAAQITLTYDTARAKEIVPTYWKHTFKNGLEAEILAGISEDDKDAGGWYIFCNDRLILGPDTTEKTGWKGGRKELPKYHDQYFRFRGYVFFNADDSSKLPWNTTKTGMNMDSPSFLLVKTQMITMGLQVKKLMDDMKKERERGNPEEKRHLNKRVQEAKVYSVSEVLNNKSRLPSVYKYPEHLLNPVSSNKRGTKITFYKPETVLKKAREYFDVDDNDSAAEMGFNYFYKHELE